MRFAWPSIAVFTAGIALAIAFTGTAATSPVTFSLAELERQGLTRAQNPQPWSGHYWPHYSGGIAFPYADPAFAANPVEEALARTDSQGPINYVSMPPGSLPAFQNRIMDQVEQIKTAYRKGRLSPDMIDRMSPAQKYDLYASDPNFELTRHALETLEPTIRRGWSNTLIAIWEGLCHGWAAASISEPRPDRVKWIQSKDRRFTIPFYPDDIKALLTYLYAKTHRPGKVVQSCASRLKSCPPLSPAKFHSAITRLIGVEHRSIVVDIDSSRAIWNQPVYGYSYTYLNPVQDPRGERSWRLKDAIVSQGSKFVVGIKMTLNYGRETRPSHQLVDRESDDRLKPIEYLYTLELNANGQVIGGDWIDSEDRPDVIWYPISQIDATRAPDWNTMEYWQSPSYTFGIRDLIRAYRQ